jgi:hypothetical protein
MNDSQLQVCASPRRESADECRFSPVIIEWLALAHDLWYSH